MIEYLSTQVVLLGIRQQVSRDAQERDEYLRDAYQLYIGTNFRADQLVFVDESGVNRISSKRAYGWSHVDTRARRRDCFVRGKRYDGIIQMKVND